MIHSSDATSYSAIRSHAGFVPPRSALVRTDTGIRLEARPKYNFLNPFRLPERNSLIVGVQPGYGIRDDNFDINGNPVPPMPPGMFSNAGASYFRYCDNGPNAGPPVKLVIAPGIFVSHISQADADNQSRYAKATMICDNTFPAPLVCCNASSRIQDLTWVSSVYGAFGSGTNSFSPITQIGTAHVEAHTSDLINGWTGRYTAEFDSSIFCNPWPDYDIEITVAFSVVAAGATVFAAIEIAMSGFVHLDDKSWTSSASGTYTVVVPASVLNGNGFIIFVDTQRQPHILFPGGNDVGDMQTISLDATITIRPLIPPDMSQLTVVELNAPPVPFHYSDRPANDDFADAVTLAASGTLDASILYASIEDNEPNTIDDDPLCASIWYYWTAPANGPVTFHVIPTDGGFPSIAAYTGITVNALTLIAGNSPFGTVNGFFPGAQITFTAVAGTTYRIQVASEGGSQEAFTLNWS